MENEKFQELVLKELRDLKSDVSGLKSDVSGLKSDVSSLKSDVSGLKSDVSGLKSDVSGLKSDVSSLKSDVSSLKSDVGEIKADVKTLNRKMDAVFEQTAGLTEFRTEANRKLDDIANTVDFLTHKESQTEKEIFVIKKSISLSK